MASAAGIKTRICMISDTHTTSPYPPLSKNHVYRNPLPKADVLLHAGDLTKVGYRTEHEETVSMLKAADAELKLVIAGNHDITLDEEHFLRAGYKRHRKTEYFGSKDIPLKKDEASRLAAIRDGTTPPTSEMQTYVRDIIDLYTNESAYAAGIRYLDEGIHTFTLSTGAKFTVYASPYQPEFFGWAFAYPRNQDRFNPPTPRLQSPHATKPGILDWVGRDGDRRVGCEHLLRASERARPRLYVFGHIHEGWGAVRGTYNMYADRGIKQEKVPTDPEEMLENRGAYYDVSSGSNRPLKFGDETLFVNASIVDIAYQPINAPWIVDIDLPRG
ncbi:hypothetical protein N7532_010713 [Penicillium argentinense]|uniref:Calcineurin-like phosphoesterase domain-containing protein n=1 Tax=Penicillium argentinense TaxID=1131581 RepID=A0A9W9EQ51_9EURO|nr:uncharacterized protein N7532_010713 [Penicillium argentinense]KAJ5085942.1 hypothetical protein N7532_010713 [Penicillium argentinense]